MRYRTVQRHEGSDATSLAVVSQRNALCLIPPSKGDKGGCSSCNNSLLAGPFVRFGLLRVQSSRVYDWLHGLMSA
jgi:hypothetical protein